MTINGKVFGIAFLLTLGAAAIAWALTTNQILNNVYISGSQSLRVVAVP